MFNNQIEMEVMVLTAKELSFEIIGLVCENDVPAEEIVVYFEDEALLAEVFEAMIKAEIQFGVTFDNGLCFSDGVKFVPWKYKNDMDYGTDYLYLLVEEEL